LSLNRYVFKWRLNVETLSHFTTDFTLFFVTNSPTVNMFVDFKHDYILKQRLLFMVRLRPAVKAETLISVPSSRLLQARLRYDGYSESRIQQTPIGYQLFKREQSSHSQLPSSRQACKTIYYTIFTITTTTSLLTATQHQSSCRHL